MRADNRQNLLQIVYEAQQKTIERMLDAWDKEIDRAIEAQLAQAKKRRFAEGEARVLEGKLLGLLAQAQAGDIVTIPAGIQVASSSISVSVGDELAALHDALQDLNNPEWAPEQHSAAWSMTHGFLPHPSDLAAVLDQHQLDQPWAEAFASSGHELKRLDLSQPGVPQLTADRGLQRLGVLQNLRRLIDNYGGARLTQAVMQPGLLKGTQAAVAPVVAAVSQATKPHIDAALAAFRFPQVPS